MIRRRNLLALFGPTLTSCTRRSGPTVRIAVPTGLVEAYLAYLAHSLGYFRDEGLNVTIHEFSGSRTVESLLGGTCEAVYSSFSAIILLAGEARRVRSIFVGLDTLSAMLVVSAQNVGRIQKAEDLKGATIGVDTLGSPQHQMVRLILSRHGITPGAVKIVAHGNGAPAVASLQYGKVDAGVINGSAFQVLKRRAPKVRALVDPRSRKATAELTGSPHYANFSLFARVEWIEREPATARKLTKAMVRALRWAHQHSPEEVWEQMPVSLHTEDKEAGIETLRYLMEGTSKDGRMPPDARAGVLRYVAQTEESVRSANIDLASTYTNQFVEEAGR